MSFREIWNGPSFLERGDAARRMRARDEAGKHAKKRKHEKQKKTMGSGEKEDVLNKARAYEAQSGGLGAALAWFPSLPPREDLLTFFSPVQKRFLPKDSH